MRRLLTHCGHIVEHVLDGLEAWDRMSKDIDYFDVLVTDHHMPGLTGLELVELLRQANYGGRIIVHSSGVEPAQADSYRAFGVASIVTKSESVRELLRAVGAVGNGPNTR